MSKKIDQKFVRYALISVSDKTGVTEFASTLVKLGYRIISTGGTAEALNKANIPTIPVSEITGNPECFGGRMKTISFAVEGGILYDRSNTGHTAEARALGVPDIRVVVCNLYPFAKTISRAKASLKLAIENIDVGGPTMVRAAAKNFQSVLVLINPVDYKEAANRLRNKTDTISYRRKLAAKAFFHLSHYDSQVASYLKTGDFPEETTIPLRRSQILRYGDNPDQKAAWYQVPGLDNFLNSLEKLAGRDPSATNITDINAGLESVRLFPEPAAVVVKHNSPCGLAIGVDIAKALTLALEADSESAFGGVVVLNKPMAFKAARAVASFKEAGRGLMDIIAAPEIEPRALTLLQSVRKTTGIYRFGKIMKPDNFLIRMISAGAVIEEVNDPEKSFAGWKTVTKKKPTPKQLKQMHFAWKAISRIRSNTVAVIDAKVAMTRGIGSGQTSRVLATKIALERAGKYTRGAILASDSFFPFDDSVQLASKAGIAAIVQQGGSVRDSDSIKAADQAGIAMVFTGQRVFWH